MVKGEIEIVCVDGERARRRGARIDTVTLFSLYLYYYQMNQSVFWTINSTWPNLSIRGKKCPIGDDQLSQLSALSISIV